ncbi:uncharacterized protein EMH_0069310 [Eimeria mitis]|uniref:MGS-like domain-containing protein n=1 Tax=Eimeria mitis TaxID=44415 RepID=U6K8D3_9EIME|nr:uncharacterized protein EMH_0069310 [Eimeria mitis]CDJ31748.1 hypothetical protein EMH_0069310 [Eimeria mitis]
MASLIGTPTDGALSEEEDARWGPPGGPGGAPLGGPPGRGPLGGGPPGGSPLTQGGPVPGGPIGGGPIGGGPIGGPVGGPMGGAPFKALETQIICVSKRETNSGNRLSAKEAIGKGLVEMVINVPGQTNHRAISSGYLIRRAAIDAGVPLLTDLKVAALFVESIAKKIYREQDRQPFWEVRAWDEYQP